MPTLRLRTSAEAGASGGEILLRATSPPRLHELQCRIACFSVWNCLPHGFRHRHASRECQKDLCRVHWSGQSSQSYSEEPLGRNLWRALSVPKWRAREQLDENESRSNLG